MKIIDPTSRYRLPQPALPDPFRHVRQPKSWKKKEEKEAQAEEEAETRGDTRDWDDKSYCCAQPEKEIDNDDVFPLVASKKKKAEGNWLGWPDPMEDGSVREEEKIGSHAPRDGQVNFGIRICI